MTRFNHMAFAALAGLSTALATTAYGQDNRWVDGAPSTEWSNDANWDAGGAPDAFLDERAILGSAVSGAANTAVVNVTGSLFSPTVVLGDGATTSGTLTIPSGSSLEAEAGIASGDFLVGNGGGAGVLNVAGALTVAGELASTSGTDSSSINLTGSASVTAGSAFFDRQLRIDGGSVSLNVGSGGAIFGLAGTHTWVIGAGGASTVAVAGNADLGGTLNVEFDGVTPVPGDTWNLIDAGTIDADDAVPSSFGQVVTTADDNLGPGERFAVSSVTGGANGVLGQLTLEQQPILRVNRNTGEVTISNPGGVASIDIDAYVIGSQVGGLNPAAFNGGFSESAGWFDANPTANNISELNPNGAGGVAASTDVSLGAIFAPPTPSVFGEVNEDVTFQYARPGGDFITGDIVFEGLPNNTLTLVVDPTTGDTQLLNPSGFTVGIDAYVISSASGSLDTVGWDSLQDQGANGGDWFEANPDADTLSELLADGAATLVGNNASILSLGAAFDAAGEQDLVLQFALEGETELRTGAVVYQSLLAGVDLPGDYNGDNVVDAADYTVWRDAGPTDVLPNDVTSGTVDGSDYDVWAANFGATLAPAAAAVPEPTSALLAVTLLAGALRRR